MTLCWRWQGKCNVISTLELLKNVSISALTLEVQIVQLWRYNLAHELKASGSWRFDLAETGSFSDLERPCFLPVKAEATGKWYGRFASLQCSLTCHICCHAIHCLYKSSKAFTSFFPPLSHTSGSFSIFMEKNTTTTPCLPLPLHLPKKSLLGTEWRGRKRERHEYFSRNQWPILFLGGCYGEHECILTPSTGKCSWECRDLICFQPWQDFGVTVGKMFRMRFTGVLKCFQGRSIDIAGLALNVPWVFLFVWKHCDVFVWRTSCT